MKKKVYSVNRRRCHSKVPQNYLKKWLLFSNADSISVIVLLNSDYKILQYNNTNNPSC